MWGELIEELILELGFEEWVILGHVGSGRLVLQAHRRKDNEADYMNIILGLLYEHYPGTVIHFK